MCGIAGWLAWNKPKNVEVVKSMIDRMVHRGPDAEGVLDFGPIILGHRRLSVIDVSVGNNQPMVDRSGRFAITYNGEIYNFQAIRKELEADGSIFFTAGDTEVVLEAYKVWGDECLERFNGMFAFAIWDDLRQRLLLARDRAGEKPLFYYQLPDYGLAFASEPGALRCHPQVSREPDPVGLAHYLQLNYTLGRHCLTRHMRRLAPGHFLVVERDRRPVIRSYWNLAEHFHNKRRFTSEGEAAEALSELIDDSVKIRMISDVPLGSFLSGGIDSSTIVAAMTRYRRPRDIKTFSVGFSDESYSEIREARNAARFLDVDHHDQVLQPDAKLLLPSLLAAADEPLADSSTLPTWFLAGHTRKYVTVALSGDGGDECFAGYETYMADKLHRFLSPLPGLLTRGATKAVDRFWPVSFAKVSFDYKLRHFLAGLNLSGPEAHFSWRTIFSREERAAIMQPDWRRIMVSEEADAFREFEPCLKDVKDCHPLDQALYVDFKTWLPDDILVKVDRLTMAHSLEARAPFLDHRLVEFAAALPASLKLKHRRNKHLLKLSQQERLPRSILYRKKQGFNAPVSGWLRDVFREFGHDTLNNSHVKTWFDHQAVQNLWREHLAGRRDNGLKLFGLICLGLWMEQL
jgi:asparagine synthase (glutamine-hydrolysing)